MTLRLSRGEFWLLSLLVRYRWPLAVLGRPEIPGSDGRSTIGEILNRRGHGLDLETLARTLRSMTPRGWIEIQQAPASSAPISNATLSWLRSAVVRPGQLVDGPHLALLPEGGAAWEHFARPDWNRFVEDWSEYDDALPEGKMRRVVTAMDARFLHRYVEAVRGEQLVTANSEQFSETEDWEMVYWKPPRHGYRGAGTVKDEYPPPSSNGHYDRWCEWP